MEEKKLFEGNNPELQLIENINCKQFSDFTVPIDIVQWLSVCTTGTMTKCGKNIV